jgi:Flp pilus assembly protein TadD
LSLCTIPTLLYSQNLNAIAELNLGIAAYDKAEYSDAIDHLERTAVLDPNAVGGHLDLAEAYDHAYGDGEECELNCDTNEHRRLRAIEEFNKVLELDPSNPEALKALAWRYHRSAKFEEADRYYRKITRNRSE